MSDRLEQIEARADAATEGPWESMRAGLIGTRVVHVDGEWDELVPDEFIMMVTPALRKIDDAEFIANAREDVPYLLALVREQQARLNKAASLHYPIEGIMGMESCGVCADAEGNEEPWPCSTSAALSATEES